MKDVSLKAKEALISGDRVLWYEKISFESFITYKYNTEISKQLFVLEGFRNEPTINILDRILKHYLISLIKPFIPVV